MYTRESVVQLIVFGRVLFLKSVLRRCTFKKVCSRVTLDTGKVFNGFDSVR